MGDLGQKSSSFFLTLRNLAQKNRKFQLQKNQSTGFFKFSKIFKKFDKIQKKLQFYILNAKVCQKVRPNLGFEVLFFSKFKISKHSKFCGFPPNFCKKKFLEWFLMGDLAQKNFKKNLSQITYQILRNEKKCHFFCTTVQCRKN